MADVGDASKEEQARRARGLAEKCFLAGNVHGARQWMQSALRLAPSLPGTAQIVAAYDVHAAAAARKPPDWYAVLGLRPPGVTHDDVKRHHRRLCLLVHPDKNPSAAADGAFKLVQAAWQTLSLRHPPGAAAAPPNQPQPTPTPRPQPPPPQRAPEPQPRPRPQVVQMRRRTPAPPPRPAATTRPSYAQQASAPKPPEKGSESTPLPTARRGKCTACGASTPNGKSAFRCGSCHWSPMDGRPDDDDDFFEEDYFEF